MSCFFHVASISIRVGACGAGAFGDVKVVGHAGQEDLGERFIWDVVAKTLPTVFRYRLDLRLLWNRLFAVQFSSAWMAASYQA